MNIDGSTLATRNEAGVIQTMSNVPASENKDYVSHNQDSAIKKVAVVQCEEFRCLAYRQDEGWRDFQTGDELPEVKSVVFEFSV